jgi:hypothetical protein
MTRHRRHWKFVSLLGVLGVLGVSGLAQAQFQMPDPKQMSGIPRPVDDLPDGAVSVRVIRGELSNNIADQQVTLRVGSKVLTAKTDASGRAQFNGLTAGATVKATTDVDGEHLESQEFPAPEKGGIRLMLVATDKNKAPATTPNAAPITGQVVMTNQSRIVMEPGDETIAVYYLLDISNTARAPVNPSTPFLFDVPKAAVGTSIVQGSSKLASVNGHRIRVEGPIPPGHTVVQVAFELPVGSGNVNVTQTFPAALEQLAVVVRKAGDATVTSPQLTRQQEFPTEGQVYIASTGGNVPAGQAISIDIAGLPHHSVVPRWIALTLALAIVVAGLWIARRPDEDAAVRAAERKRLLAKRDKLFAELVRLENDRRSGRGDDRRYATRREELVTALEHVYGALDTDDASPESAERAGVGVRVDALTPRRSSA